MRLKKRLLAFSLFFFHAENDIRYYKVTGVQTCALPIPVPQELHQDGDRPGRPSHLEEGVSRPQLGHRIGVLPQGGGPLAEELPFKGRLAVGRVGYRDRKSTRLNSSHLVISYAVFCLKKK